MKIINGLDANKAHGYDGISIKMVKICSRAIAKPLCIIFKNCLNEGIFPNIWKKANVVPIHKKGDKRIISNYRPISLLPIFGKIFERIIYNRCFEFLMSNSLINTSQSGFIPRDSCINQLLSITHNIYSAFDANPTLEVKGVFLDISKAFDRVWHDGLIYKLNRMGINGNLKSLLESFLSDRYQRVVLNGQSSDWAKINAGVPQGSILAPMLFLVYINDITEELSSGIKLFADDTSIFSVVHNPESTGQDLNRDLILIKNWGFQWKMDFNPDPTKPAKSILFSRKVNAVSHPEIYYNENPIQQTNSHKHLGLILDKKLSFTEHLDEKILKAYKGIGILRKLSHFFTRHSLITIYKSFIRPHIDYCDVIYDKPNNTAFKNKIEKIQYDSALAITGAIRGTSKEKLYKELGLEYLDKRRWMRRLCLFKKVLRNRFPIYLHNIIPNPIRIYNTRNANLIPQIPCRSLMFSSSFFPYTISEWNKLDEGIRKIDSFEIFKNSLLKIIRPAPNNVFLIRDATGLKLLTRLRLGLSHLREHKFSHNFQDTVNPLCSCSLELENVEHFFLRCHHFNQSRFNLKNELQLIDPNISYLPDKELTQVLLFGNSKFSSEINTKILQSSIKYIENSKRFEGSLF